jgi:thiamine transport system permease protein
VFGRIDLPGRSALRVAVTLPFVLPTVVVSMAFLALAGPHGVFADVFRLDGTLAGIVAAHAFFNTAVVARIVGGHWARLDRRLEDAARVLGASRRRVFREVTLPALRPAVLSAAVLTFLFTCTSFGVVVLLGRSEPGHPRGGDRARHRDPRPGGRVRARPRPARNRRGDADPRGPAARPTQRRRRHGPEQLALRRPATTTEKVKVGATLTAAAIFLGGPILVLVERSLRVGDGYGFDWYTSLDDRAGTTLFASPWESVRTSLAYASVAATIAVVVGVAAATATAARRDRLSRGTETLLALPLGHRR